MQVDMNEFKEFEVPETNRQGILEKIMGQIDQWGLRLPEVPYLMVDFGLRDFFRTGETEFWVANEIESGYCGKLMFVFDGQICPYHSHRVKHETFYIVKGQTRMVVEGKELVKQMGDLLVVPPGTKHSFAGLGPCLLLEVSMPSVPRDSYFEDTSIGDNGVL